MPRRPDRTPSAYTIDLWHGEGIQRQDGTDQADTLKRARQEMMDTASDTLMDAIASAPVWIPAESDVAARILAIHKLSACKPSDT